MEKRNCRRTLVEQEQHELPDGDQSHKMTMKAACIIRAAHNLTASAEDV